MGHLESGLGWGEIATALGKLFLGKAFHLSDVLPHLALDMTIGRRRMGGGKVSTAPGEPIPRPHC